MTKLVVYFPDGTKDFFNATDIEYEGDRVSITYKKMTGELEHVNFPSSSCFTYLYQKE